MVLVKYAPTYTEHMMLFTIVIRFIRTLVVHANTLENVTSLGQPCHIEKPSIQCRRENTAEQEHQEGICVLRGS